MASRGGGRSPGPVNVGRGASGRGLGRGRSAGGGAQNAPRSPGSPRSQPPLVSALRPDFASCGRHHETKSGERLSVRAHVTSLASDAVTDDVKEYFKTQCDVVCEEEVELSAVLLGSGKAELMLRGISASELEDLKSETHMIKGSQIEVDFQTEEEGPPPLVGDSDEEDEESLVTIRVENVPHKVTIAMVKAFVEMEKNGGNPGAVADISNIKPGVFQVRFHDHTVAARVMSEPRKLKKADLEMRWLKEEGPSEREESDSEDECNQIEVHNVPSSVTENMLKTYFEMNKSGGGRNAVADCKQVREGIFTVTFHDPRVAAKVISQPNHTLKKAALSLQYVRQSKEKEEYKMNQLLIRGLPRGVEKGVHELNIADCLDMDEEEDFDLVINDDSSAVLTFAKSYSAKELQDMTDKITSKDIDGTVVTVEMVKGAKPSLHVHNISTLCNEEFLKMYFGSKEMSGGGEVDSVTVLSETEAVVTFVDLAVVHSVLERKHSVFGPEAKITLHERSRAWPSASVSDSVSQATKALKIPLDPLFAQSINLDPSTLEQSLENSQVNISVDEEKGMLVLSPTGKPKPNWRQECEQLVPEYLARSMKKEKVLIPKEAMAQAKALLVKLKRENPGFTCYLSEDESEITMVGKTDSISQAKEALNSLCFELVVDTASVLLSPEDFDFVEQVKQRDFPSNVECTFDSSKFSLVLKGPKGEVTKMKDSMEDVVSHSDTPALLDPMVTEFFKTPTGRGKVEKFLQERQCRAALHFSQTPTLLLHLLSDRKEASKVKAVVAQLHLHVTSQGIPIPVTVVPIIDDFEEFIQLCQMTEEKYEVLVKHVGHDVSAAGFKTQVSSSLTEIKAFLDKLASPIPPLEIKVSTLVAKSLHKSQHGLQKCLESVRLYCDTGRGVLQFTPLHYLKPGWEETCKERVSGYVNKNIADLKVSVPGEAYSEVMKELYVSEQDDDTFVFHYPPSATSLSLAGRPDIVKMTQEKFVHICASHSFTTEEVPLKPEEYEFITQLQMEHLISKFRSVEIEAVPETYSLTLSGPAKGVKAVKEHIPSITKIVSVHVDMDKAVVQYLGTENGREKLIGLLREKRADKCAVCISDSPAKLSLVCAQKYKNMAERASKSITGTTSRQPLDIPDLLLPVLHQLPEFTAMVRTMERELPVMITVEGKSVVVAGFQDGVMHASDNLSAFVKKKMIHFQPVVIPVDPMIALCVHNSQRSLQACMSSIHVTCKLECSKQKSTATMYPSRETKSDWKKECQSLFSSYVSKEYSTETIEIPKEAARSVFPILASAKTKHNFHFEMDDDGECATVAGERSAVEAVKKKIDRIFTQTQTTETRKLSQRDYEYFTQVVQKNLTSETDIELSPEMHSLTATGSVHAVSAVMKSMQETVQYDVVPVSVDEIMVQFIRTQGRKRLENLMLQQRIEAAIHVDISANPATLELLCKTQTGQHVRSFAETFPKNIEITAFPLPKTVTRPPLSHEFSQYCKELAVEHEVSIILKPDAVQICGFKDDSSEVLKSVERFIKKKCTVSRAFSIQKGMWRLLGGPMKGKWIKIDNMCRDSEVSLALPSDYDEKLVINFKGDKSEVLKAIEAMNTLITSIETATVSLKRPEIQRYFSEKEDGGMKIPGIERSANVCIELCVVGEDEEWGVEEGVTPTDEAEFKAVARPVPKQSKVCTAQVVGMKRITIHVGDITEFRADVIVNAANEDLKHIGGVADSVLKKGGQAIQDASDRYRKSHGKLSAGDVWLSPVVGRLPCLALVHAVGPRWQGNPAGRQQLRKVCINSLKAAKDYNSIAIPAISSGMFGCPMDQCAEVMISATVEFCRKAQATFPLDDINIVLFQQSDAIHFIRQLKVYLPPENIQHKGSANSSYHAHGSPQPQPQSRYFEDFSQQSSSYAYEHHPEEEDEEESDEANEEVVEEAASPSSLSRVQVRQGSILDVEAQIYVNSTNGNMDLTGGAVAQALSKAAGPVLQAECNDKAPIAAGEIAVTGPGNIRRCRCIIHINCPGYDKSGGQAEEMLGTIMHRCMKECDKQGASTIVFPAIGTGNLGFPTDVAAHIMVDEVCNYLQKNKCKSLSMVYFIIFMKNMYQAFDSELETRKKTAIRKVTKIVAKEEVVKPKKKKSRGKRGKRHKQHMESTTQSASSGSQSLDLQNGVTLEIVKGDITLEKTDVIVNTTDEQMSLGGGVGAALARRAGKGLQEACRKVKPYNKSSLRDGKVIETKPGNLNCKCVLHMMFQKHNFVEVIVTCIEKARGLKFRSIAFPAVGTGAERFPVEDAAKGMLKGLQKCRASTQMNVRIVLLDDTYHKFVAALEGKQQPWYQRAIKAIGGLVPWGSTPADKDDEEPMDVDSSNDLELRIYGETQEYVKSAEESLYSLINRQFKTEEIEDERIGLLSESQKVYLQKEAHKMQLTFRMDRNLNLIELKGSKESISEMKFKVHAVMTKVESEANREKQAETMKKTIKWLRQDSNDPDYEPLTNLEIEEKYHASGGKSDYTFKDDVSGEHFTIDFQKMIEIDHTMGDKTCEVRRVTTGTDVLPVDWESMTDPSSKKEVPLRVIDLATSSRGYQFVLKEFNKTMTQGLNYTAIVKIQRIQNPALYGQYASKKKNLDLHNQSSVQNERWLFHGTKQSVISHINQTNFNRSLSGQNGTIYGRGCYFARDASYSNTYAPPDAQGQKHMYLVRVLTGEYTTGSGTMMVAPPKDPKDPTVPFDSVVDDATNPGIFVVFFDAGAYPEYLITYQ
jgi:poly [ADP-ribose] polymerase 10/14/15